MIRFCKTLLGTELPVLLTEALLTPAAKDKGEKKLFGYSFVPLMQEDGRTLPDGTHELIIHKVRAAFPLPTRGPSLLPSGTRQAPHHQSAASVGLDLLVLPLG